MIPGSRSFLGTGGEALELVEFSIDHRRSDCIDIDIERIEAEDYITAYEQGRYRAKQAERARRLSRLASRAGIIFEIRLVKAMPRF